MLEIVGWAFFAGCVVAAFLVPICAVVIVGERIYRKVNPQSKEG